MTETTHPAPDYKIYLKVWLTLLVITLVMVFIQNRAVLIAGMTIKASLIGAAHKDIGIEKTLVRKALFILLKGGEHWDAYTAGVQGPADPGGVFFEYITAAGLVVGRFERS